MMKRPTTVSAVTDLRRVRLSKSFFMRDLLDSEVAVMHELINVPGDPALAISAGTRFCEDLLKSQQDYWSPIGFRSTCRSNIVNGLFDGM
jgi:hypothetical protein